MIDPRLRDAALRVFAERTTHITVSELAAAAGVARGTVYNHVPDIETVFQQLATELATEMQLRAERSMEAIADPARRLATGVRLFLRRTHREPRWGQFVCRFAVSEPSLQSLWQGGPGRDLAQGIDSGRFVASREQIPSLLALVGGSVMAAMVLVIEGHKTWRDAGADVAELLLRALGLSHQEARQLAMTALPPLLPAESEA